MYHQLQKVALTFILVFAMTVGYGQSEWLTYKSPNEDFTVSCPGGLLQHKKQLIKTSVGELTNNMHFIQLDGSHPNKVYVVSSIPYPKSTFPTDSIELISDFLTQTSESIEDLLGQKAQYKDLNFEDDAPYLLMRIQNKSTNTTIKTKLILINDILFTIQVFTDSELALNKLIDRFIQSFKVL